jgi:hypothetical protein
MALAASSSSAMVGRRPSSQSTHILLTALRVPLNLVAIVCQECTAFIANYKMATECYAKLGKDLMKLTTLKDFSGPEFQRVKQETQKARDECILAREALHVHQQSHHPKIST